MKFSHVKLIAQMDKFILLLLAATITLSSCNQEWLPNPPTGELYSANIYNICENNGNDEYWCNYRQWYLDNLYDFPPCDSDNLSNWEDSFSENLTPYIVTCSVMADDDSFDVNNVFVVACVYGVNFNDGINEGVCYPCLFPYSLNEEL